MNYKGYYNNPNKRFKRDFILGLVILPIILIVYLIDKYWDIIKEWFISFIN